MPISKPVSGITTTGATVLSGLDNLPHVDQPVARTCSNWFGGMGMIVLAVAILPLLGVGGMQMFKAETPGPDEGHQAHPAHHRNRQGPVAGLSRHHHRVHRVALAGGHELVRCRHVTPLPRWGWAAFPSHDASVGYFNSPAIEVVTDGLHAGGRRSIFPPISWRGGNAAAAPIATIRKYAGFCCWSWAAVLGIAIYLAAMRVLIPIFWRRCAHASFNPVSIATTTRLCQHRLQSVADFRAVVDAVSVCCAVSSGSTGGGIKMMRSLLMFKQGRRELTRHVHPAARLPVKLGGQLVSNQRDLCRAGLCLALRRQHHRHDLLLIASGLEFHHRLFRGDRLHQQHRPGAESGGPGHQLTAF